VQGGILQQRVPTRRLGIAQAVLQEAEQAQSIGWRANSSQKRRGQEKRFGIEGVVFVHVARKRAHGGDCPGVEAPRAEAGDQGGDLPRWR
jgi:hypothetical protein